MDQEDVSHRHLYTFHQIEVELRTESVDEVITLAETIISDSAKQVSLFAEQTWGAGASIYCTTLESVPFPRISFSEAAGLVGLSGNPRELTLDEEEVLGLEVGRPYWIVDYPEGVRDSLYRFNGKTYDTYDLMLPVRGGELATGGLRPESAQEVRRQSALVGGQPNEWYADWKERTGLQSGGFGIGFERLVRYIIGAESVVDVVPFHDRGPNLRI
jgi:asparaginyl-tRNA synthetase